MILESNGDLLQIDNIEVEYRISLRSKGCTEARTLCSALLLSTINCIDALHCTALHCTAAQYSVLHHEESETENYFL